MSGLLRARAHSCVYDVTIERARTEERRIQSAFSMAALVRRWRLFLFLSTAPAEPSSESFSVVIYPDGGGGSGGGGGCVGGGSLTWRRRQQQHG